MYTRQTIKRRILQAVFLSVLVSLNLSFLLPASAAPGVPTILAYQGRLKSSSGALLGGAGTTYYFKFSLWDAASVGSGSRLWPASAPTNTSATVIQGVFNVNIGDTASGYPDALDYNFSDNQDIYLQVEIATTAGGTYETIGPRQRVTAAGFAINAKTVGGFNPNQNFAVGTTTLAANSVFTVATSTSMFNVTNAGNVGVGTATPGYKLQVVGDLNATELYTDNIYSVSANNTSIALNGVLGTVNTIYSASSSYVVKVAGGSNLMTILGSGNVGIGTTAPSSTLDVVPGATAMGLSGNSYGISVRKNAWVGLGLDGASTGSMIMQYDGDSSKNLVFSKYSGDNFNTWTGDVATFNMGAGHQSLVLNSSSNFSVGGATTGASKLSVNGSASIGSTYFNTTAPSDGMIVQGSVGIGTASPLAPLDVRNTLLLPGSTQLVLGGPTSGTMTKYSILFNDVNQNDLTYRTYRDHIFQTDTGDGTAGTNRLVIKGSTGNVGIGTSTPIGKFTVYGLGGGSQYLDYGGTGTGYANTSGAALELSDYFGTNQWGAVVDNSGNFTIQKKNTPAYGLTILTGNGNVGIGTTAPSSTLHVVGSSDQKQLIARGNSTQTGNIFEVQKSDGTPLMGVHPTQGAIRKKYSFTPSGSSYIWVKFANSEINSGGKPAHFWVTRNIGAPGSVYGGPTTEIVAFNSETHNVSGRGYVFNEYRGTSGAEVTDVAFDGQNNGVYVKLKGGVQYEIWVADDSGVLADAVESDPTFGMTAIVAGMNVIGNAKITGTLATGDISVSGYGDTTFTTGNASAHLNHFYNYAGTISPGGGDIFSIGNNLKRTDAGITKDNAPLLTSEILTSSGYTTQNFISLRTNDVNRLHVDYLGNVGIGTDSPSSTLHVIGTFQTSGAATIAGNLAIGNGSTGSMSLGDGTITKSPGVNFTFNSGLTSNGISSPSAAIDTLTLGRNNVADTAYNLILDNSGVGLGRLGIASSTGSGVFTTGGLGYATMLGTNDATALQLFTNDAARLTIDTSGRVGIGTTAPSSMLHVVGDVQISSTTMAIWQMTGGSYTAAARLDNSNHFQFGTVSNAVLGFIQNNAEAMRINTGGNVSIGGSSNPTEKLQVYGGATSTAILVNSSLGGSAEAAIKLQSHSAFPTWRIATRGNNLYFGPSSSDFMTMTDTGLVGIGTAAPSSTLHVAGNMQGTGDLYLNGDTVHTIKTTYATGSPTLALEFPNAGSVMDDGIVLRATGYGQALRVSSRRIMIGNLANNIPVYYTDSNSSERQLFSANALTIPSDGIAGSVYTRTSGNAGAGIQSPTSGTFALGFHSQGLSDEEIIFDILNSGGGRTDRISTMASARISSAVDGLQPNQTALIINSLNTLSTSTAKLLSIQNNTVEKAFVDYAGGAYFAGKVGIGTSTPESNLYVAGDGLSGVITADAGANSVISLTAKGYSNWGSAIALNNVTANKSYIAYQNTAGNFNIYDTTFGDRFTLTGAGNIGIGTSTPETALEVKGDIRMSAGAERTLYSGTTASPQDLTLAFGDTSHPEYGPMTIKYEAQGGGYVKQTNSGSGIFMYSAYGAEFHQGYAGTYFYSGTTGAAGIPGFYFRSDPADAATFVGARFDTSNAISTTGAKLFAIAEQGSDLIVVDHAGNLGIGTTAPSSTLHVVGTSAFTATSTFSGNVGIGTATPEHKLDIAGGGTNIAESYYYALGGSDNNGLTRGGAFYGTGNMGLQNYGGNINLMTDGRDLNYIGSWGGSPVVTFKGSGNVGIGTSAPSSTLHIANSSAAPVLRIDSLGSTSFHPKLELYRNSSVNGYLEYSGSGGDLAIVNGWNDVTGDITLTTNGGERVRLTGAGNLVVGSSTAATLFTVATSTNIFNVTSAGNVGIGTSTPSSLFTVATSTSIMTVASDGSVVVGVPTGGAKGYGTINAQAVYDDNTLLTDFVFDKYYDGSVLPEDADLHGEYKMLTIDQMMDFNRTNRHLPTITGREEWNKQGGLSLGKLASQFWESIETQALYIGELNSRIKALELSASSTAPLQGSFQSSAQLPVSDLTVTSLKVTGNLTVAGLVSFNGDTVGQAKILNGAMRVKVDFQDIYVTAPIITATARDFIAGQYRVTEVTEKGFVIELQQIQGSDVAFDWHAFASGEKTKLFVSNGTSQPVQLIVVQQNNQSGSSAQAENPIVTGGATQSEPVSDSSSSTQAGLPPVGAGGAQAGLPAQAGEVAGATAEQSESTSSTPEVTPVVSEQAQTEPVAPVVEPAPAPVEAPISEPAPAPEPAPTPSPEPVP